jgi:hypothetical protein
MLGAVTEVGRAHTPTAQCAKVEKFLVVDIFEAGERLGVGICNQSQEFDKRVSVPQGGRKPSHVIFLTVLELSIMTIEASHNAEGLQRTWEDACWAKDFFITPRLLPDEKVQRHCKGL